MANFPQAQILINSLSKASFKMGSLEERLTLSHVFLPVSLIILVSGYLELI